MATPLFFQTFAADGGASAECWAEYQLPAEAELFAHCRRFETAQSLLP